MSTTENMVDAATAAAEEDGLPDDLYAETEGVEMRMHSPGPGEHSPVHVEALTIEASGESTAIAQAYEKVYLK